MKEFICFHKMAAPRHLSAEAVEAFLTHLAVPKQGAASTQSLDSHVSHLIPVLTA
ncbi:MAG: hypothetical protein H7Z11_15845 [Verrucomicrobia bacterium]|nr:hypothetical protein [Leptolyngbya sp. ES-bin-22]